MNRPVFFVIPAMMLGIILSAATSFAPSTKGSPAGYSGSPADAKDCSACHKAKAVAKEGLITISGGGTQYIPGKTYTIITVLKGTPKSKKFGFQLSPQDAKGKLLGKMVVTDATGTAIAKGNKYINQTEKGVDGAGSKTWSFDWVAPEKGAGEVTFYGSYLIGGQPETIYNSKLVLKESK